METMLVIIEILGVFWLLMAFAYLFKTQGIKEANKFVVDNYKPNNVYKKFLKITNYWYNDYIKKGKYCTCCSVVLFIMLIIAILCSK
jgi:hypothetical protein